MGDREWSEAPEVTAGPSWAIAEAALNQTLFFFFLKPPGADGLVSGRHPYRLAK